MKILSSFLKGYGNMKKLLNLFIVSIIMSLLVIPILPHGIAYAYSGTSSNVTTSISSGYVTNYNWQKKIFYSQNLTWVFYNPSDGHNGFRTSNDTGTTWSSYTETATLGTGGAHSIAYYINGTTLHYVRTTQVGGQGAYYRAGTISNTGGVGTISWLVPETQIYTTVAPATTSYGQIITDSNNMPWVGFVYYPNGFGVTPYSTIILKSTTNNGTWTNDAGFPYTMVSGYTQTYPVPQLVKLTAGKMYVVFSTDNHTNTTEGKEYNAGWQATENTTLLQSWYSILGANSYGDDVYVVSSNHREWESGNSTLQYSKRTYGSGWSSNISISGNPSSNDVWGYPGLTITGNNSAIAYWQDAPTKDHIYYARMTNGIWSAPVDWIDTTLASMGGIQFPLRVGLNNIDLSNEIMGSGLLYSTGNSSGNMFVFFAGINGIPTVTTQAASSVGSTTAVANGTIVGTGGDNPNSVFVQYGTNTGNYTSNFTNTGNYTATTFTVNMSGLSSNTTYYARVGANNTIGIAYGNEITFTTQIASSAPSVTTLSASQITDTTANLSGNLTSLGTTDVTLIGIEWDIDAGAPYANNWTSTGNFSTGIFSNVATLLPSGTTIYFRVFAQNSVNITYGSELTLLTIPSAPTNVSATQGTSTSNVTITWTKSTGATNYTIWRDSTNITSVGDNSSYADTTASNTTLNGGTASASDGTSNITVSLAVTGTGFNTTTHVYKVEAINSSGASENSTTATGYKGIGAITYQWYRSSGDASANFSAILGATTISYLDTGGVYTPDGRYYKVELSANGASNVTSTSDRGYMSLTMPTSLTPANSILSQLIIIIVSMLLIIIMQFMLPSETSAFIRIILIAVAIYAILSLLPGLQDMINNLQ